jgi:hypothetical protein
VTEGKRGCSDPEEPLQRASRGGQPAAGIALPTATYSLDEAAQAWEAQASSPGKKIVVIP